MPPRNLAEIAGSTLEAIVRSPDVAMFNVGITMRADQRRRQYALYSSPRPWNHMAFLAFGLTLLQAKRLEQHLFEHCKEAKTSSARYKKYSPVKESVYRSSAGGRADDGLANYSVYVAWCGRG